MSSLVDYDKQKFRFQMSSQGPSITQRINFLQRNSLRGKSGLLLKLVTETAFLDATITMVILSFTRLIIHGSLK